jgi:hypothetical protein
MTRKHALLTGIALAHLLVVALGAANCLPFRTPALNWYGSMTGATSRFGFFRMVGPGCRVTFIMTDREGNSWKDELSRAGNHESTMRSNGSIYMINDLNHSLAASWAATMFARHSSAHQVTVQFEVYDPPAMADYSAGLRPEWRTVYAMAVIRREDVPSARPEND